MRCWNCDNELLIVVWFDKEGVGEKVLTKTSYINIPAPSSVSGNGLYQVFVGTLLGLGVTTINQEDCSKLVGVGTDGAAANVASAGLKGLVKEKIPWVFWMWCLAHRLELAIKDALKVSYFDMIDEMLFRLYLLYEKSPKKCQELEPFDH